MSLRLDQLPPATGNDLILKSRLAQKSTGLRMENLPPDEQSFEQQQQRSNEEFRYAQEENLPIEDARIVLNNQRQDEEYKQNLKNLIRYNLIAAAAQDVVREERAGQLQQHLNALQEAGKYKPEKPSLTAKEVGKEAMYSVERGALGLAKVPGVLLKAAGEITPPETRAALLVPKMLVKAGDNCINYYNWVAEKNIPRSNEIEWAKSQSFWDYPILRTTTALGESAPGYAAAVAVTLLTKNPSLGATVIGTTAAAQTYEDLRADHVAPSLALLGAALVGSIEILTEKVPMDALLKGGAKPWLRRFLETGTKESMQELMAQLGQNYVTAVMRDIDPADYSTVLPAVQQEWSVISQGWEDAMASGFLMGGAASLFAGRPDLGRNAEQLVGEYQLDPNIQKAYQNTTHELLAKIDAVRQPQKAAQPTKPVSRETVPIQEQVYMKGFAARLTSIRNNADNIVAGAGKKSEQIKTMKEEITRIRDHYQSIAETIEQNKEVLPQLAEIKQLLPDYEQAISEFTQKPSQKGFEQIKAVGDKIAELSTAYGQQISTETAKQIVVPSEQTRVRGLAQSVEDRAIEVGLVETLGKLPEYGVLNMTETARQSRELLQTDPEKAKRILNLEEPPPAGQYVGTVFTAAEILARNNGDTDALLELAHSKTVAVATELGRQVKAFDPGLQENSPARDMRSIMDARRAMAEQRKQKVPSSGEMERLQKRAEEAETKLAHYLARSEKPKPTRRTQEYGGQNKFVKKSEYEEIIARRSQLPPLKGEGKYKGAVYIPTTQDFVDLAKIGLYHMEAIGRNFADWSAQVVRDLGDWVRPHLQDEFNKALSELQRQGIEPIDKKLESYKKRLRTLTGKMEEKFVTGDVGKKTGGKLVLDPEGKKLKREYESARDKLQAAREAGGEITRQEAEKITELSKIAADKKESMVSRSRRSFPGAPTQAEMEWGTAQVLYSEYVQTLKQRAEKLTFSETLMEYLKNPLKVLSDIAGILRSIVASWDNSFIGRQGLLVFYKGLTGDLQSAKIWADTFAGSWMTIWKTARGQGHEARMALKAMQISDPEYELIRQTKTDIATIEEEFPSEIPSKIPLLGRIFEASENAYVWSAHYMRYRLVKMELEIYRNEGGDMTNKRELESIGLVTNSLTGRGKIGRAGSTPGFINNLFFSPRYLKSTLDFLTAHLFDPNVSGRMKKRAATNLVRFISGAAALLLIADWIDDDSVTWDPNNADFGKIRIGNSRFSVGGSIPALIVLSSRLVSGVFVSSVTGKKKKLNTGKYFDKTKLDLVYDFFENKFSPAAQIGADFLRGHEKYRSQFEEKYGPLARLSPLSVQTILESATIEDRANLMAIIIAEGLGVNVQTYEATKEKRGAFE